MWKRISIAGGVVAIVVLALIVYLSLAPGDFPSGKIITIKKGAYMSQAADMLKADGVIRSTFIFKAYVMLLTGHRQVQAGDYLFSGPESALRTAYRTIYGIEGIPQVRVTLFEGMTSADMAATIKKAIPGFDAQTFENLAKPLEGQLFPDTYYLYENVTPEEVIDQLHTTFADKTKPLLLEIQASGRGAEDIITMASLVEREATSSVDRRIIAGILWRRIDLGMPLQVDAPFYFLLGKDSAHLTMNDLALNSAYNLYKHTGLPPTPIDNPGLSAIEDTANPTKSNYLYFLSGRDGRMHYAATLEQHVANKVKYLD